MIVHANILDWAASYDGPLMHACLCDAPYEMEFMGKDWDNSGVAFNPETWKAIARCLHPGAFLFVFAGTINDDLISVAMRQAGLRKYHKAAAWSYGSGFPKAARLDTVIDRRAGVERTKVGTRKHQPKFAAAEFDYRKKDNGYNSKERETFDLTKPATPLAEAWQGHRYGGQMLKPALESILIFQKPYAGRPVDSITRIGAGALNVDGGRIGTDEQWSAQGEQYGGISQGIYGDGLQKAGRSSSSPAGRWPANLVLSHHPECQPIGTRRVRGTKGDADYTPTGVQGPASIVTNVKTGRHHADPDGYETISDWHCHPDCAVYRLGLQSGETSSGVLAAHHNRAEQRNVYGTYSGKEWDRDFGGDTGTAARFFFQADYLLERLEDADAVVYEAKSSRSEREAGLDPRQVKLINRAAFDEATINDGREKPIDNPYQRGKTTRRNSHPTIKPIALARHLATLLLPPDMYAPRRLLIPFAGAGSEMIGAMLAGWEEIVGVELEADHIRIAEARLAYWQQRRHGFLDPSKPITAELRDAPDGQLDMFDEAD